MWGIVTIEDTTFDAMDFVLRMDQTDMVQCIHPRFQVTGEVHAYFTDYALIEEYLTDPEGDKPKNPVRHCFYCKRKHKSVCVRRSRGKNFRRKR